MQPPPPPLLTPSGVLVVEEEEPVRALLAHWLRGLGHPTRLAASGPEALTLLARWRPAAALIDVGMADWDGPQTLVALRALAPDLPCCFLTGGPATAEELADLGGDLVLRKPFAEAELAAALRGLGVAADRRGSVRLDGGALPLPLAREAGGPAEGWLADCSAGGAGLWLDRPVEPGSVFRLGPRPRPGARVLVRHCRPEGRRWRAGCEFAPESRAG